MILAIGMMIGIEYQRLGARLGVKEIIENMLWVNDRVYA